jgi:hypothetical protein
MGNGEELTWEQFVWMAKFFVGLAIFVILPNTLVSEYHYRKRTVSFIKITIFLILANTIMATVYTYIFLLPERMGIIELLILVFGVLFVQIIWVIANFSKLKDRYG